MSFWGGRAGECGNRGSAWFPLFVLLRLWAGICLTSPLKFQFMAGCSCDRPDSDSRLWRLKTRQVSDLPEVKAVMAVNMIKVFLLFVAGLTCGMSSFGIGRNPRPGDQPRCSPMHSVAWERHWRLCCNAPKYWGCQSHLGVKEVSAAVRIGDDKWAVVWDLFYILCTIYIVCIVCIWWKLKCRWFYATFL